MHDFNKHSWCLAVNALQRKGDKKSKKEKDDVDEKEKDVDQKDDKETKSSDEKSEKTKEDSPAAAEVCAVSSFSSTLVLWLQLKSLLLVYLSDIGQSLW